jgi:hypothetical protein
VSWLQSTARHNSFVPFLTVDGHSVCCEIDESCGTMAKFIPSMENCLAIFWPYSKYHVNANEDEYWKKGSTIRMESAHAERQYRRDKRNEVDGTSNQMIRDLPPHGKFIGCMKLSDAYGGNSNEFPIVQSLVVLQPPL